MKFQPELESLPYPTTEIKLRIESSLRYRVLDEFSENDVVENEDGSFIVTMNFIEDEWVYGYILSFGEIATVIQPQRIKETIKKKLGSALSNYS